MDASYRLILLLMLSSFSNLVFAQDYQDPKGLESRISRFFKNESSCQYRKQQGFCHRRYECSRPTSQVCQSGQDPIVCCLDTDKHEQKRRTRYLLRKKRSYPGCGLRSPRIQGNRAGISNNRLRGRGWRGKRSSGGFPMVVGGYVAHRNSWPWMVAIYRLENAQFGHIFICGGSLISQNFVLSAAHCFHGEEELQMIIHPSQYFVVLGKHTRNDGTPYPVRRILIHPGYKRPMFYHDICLITVGRPVELSMKVYPVCLPSVGMSDQLERDYSIVTVTGWGDIRYGGSKKDELQELTKPIVPFGMCSAAYSTARDNYPHGFTKQQMCAGFPEGGKGACHGDSGGPLVSKLQDNSYVQVGVVSFGYKCALPRYPAIYTRVSQYLKWIYDNSDLGK